MKVALSGSKTREVKEIGDEEILARRLVKDEERSDWEGKTGKEKD